MILFNIICNCRLRSGPGISAASRKRLQKKYRLSVQEKPIPKVFEGTSASRNKVSDNVEVYDLWAPGEQLKQKAREVQEIRRMFYRDEENEFTG